MQMGSRAHALPQAWMQKLSGVAWQCTLKRLYYLLLY